MNGHTVGLLLMQEALAARDQRIEELEKWKAGEQQYALECATLLLQSGVKFEGDGIKEGIKAVIADNTRLREALSEIRTKYRDTWPIGAPNPVLTIIDQALAPQPAKEGE